MTSLGGMDGGGGCSLLVGRTGLGSAMHLRRAYGRKTHAIASHPGAGAACRGRRHSTACSIVPLLCRSVVKLRGSQTL